MAFWNRWFGNSIRGQSRNIGIQENLPSGRGDSTPNNVTFDSAMSLSAFWASARLLSETMGAMELKAYRIDADGTKTLDNNNQLYRILNYRPNRYQTRNEFMESMMLNLVTTGNAYAAIERDSQNKIFSLLPLMSSQMKVDLLDNGDTVYCYTRADGAKAVYSSDSIWHIKLFGNGVVGLSVLGYAARTLGIAINNEKTIGKLSANGGKRSGVLMLDGQLTEEQRNLVRANFNGLTEGVSDNLFVLEAGMKFEPTTLTPSDMEILESRRFQIEDIARFMGVPSVLINDLANATAWGSGIQQIIDGFFKLNLRPYIERFESSIVKNLMTPDKAGNVAIEFDFNDLLEPDKKTRFETYNKAVNSGVLAPNEARANESLPPKDGGDDLIVNGNMIPINQVQNNPFGGGNATQASESTEQ